MRRIPLSRRSHITGFQTLLISGLTEHESALERDFVALTTFRDAAARIISQPITVSFREGPTPRRYTPDFLVHWSDGRSELVEVKYRADLREHWRELRTGFIVARSWTREHGDTFRIATDGSIRTPYLENARRLLPLRTAPVDSAVAAGCKFEIPCPEERIRLWHRHGTRSSATGSSGRPMERPDTGVQIGLLATTIHLCSR